MAEYNKITVLLRNKVVPVKLSSCVEKLSLSVPSKKFSKIVQFWGATLNRTFLLVKRLKVTVKKAAQTTIPKNLQNYFHFNERILSKQKQKSFAVNDDFVLLSLFVSSFRNCRWLDSNLRPLQSQTTAMSTVPQPLTPRLNEYLATSFNSLTWTSFEWKVVCWPEGTSKFLLNSLQAYHH